MKKSVHSKAIWITVLTSIAIIAVGISVICTEKNNDKKLKEQLSFGEQYYEEENYGQARYAYEKALHEDDTCVEAYLGLAKVYEALENDTKAAEVLQKGVDKTKDERLREELERINKKLGQKGKQQTSEPEAIPTPDDNKEAQKGYIKKLERKEFPEVKNLPEEFTEIVGNEKTDTAMLVMVTLLDLDQDGIEELLFNSSRYKEGIYVYSYKSGEVIYCGMLPSLENNIVKEDVIDYTQGPFVLYYKERKVIRTDTLDGQNENYQDTKYGYELVNNNLQQKYEATERGVTNTKGNLKQEWKIDGTVVSEKKYESYCEENLPDEGEVIKFITYKDFLRIYQND